MEKRHSISRKSALKFLTLGTFSTVLAPSLFKSAKASTAEKTGAHLSYDDIFNQTYPFALPDLPYAHDALEPAIDTKTMEIHHGRHHQGYVNNLNNALESHSNLQSMTLADLNRHLNGSAG
jgi:superoxide dismutase, Fe-Mn family